MSTRIIQVTNVPTSVTREQFRALFSNLGRIDDLVIYPESESRASNVAAKVGYVKFTSSETAQAALNLTSTVYIDRPLLISLVRPSSSSSSARIPEESSALKYCPPPNTNIVLLPNGPTWSHKTINRKVTVPAKDDKPAKTHIETKDYNLTDRSLPEYPNLPGSTEQAKVEEIRRTVFVSNLDPRVSLENLYDFFSQIGEIKYIRMTKSVKNVEYENIGLMNEITVPKGVDLESDSVGAYIEFSEQPSVVKALCLNGFTFAEREIKVNHSTQTVHIPENKKEQVNIDDIKKDKKPTKNERKKTKHGKREKHGGSASDSSSKSSDEADSAVEPSPPRKQRRSRSKSNSKSKSKSSRRSRSKEKERKERDRDKKRDREREKSRRSRSGSRSTNKKRKDDKDRDREREKERSSSHKKDKKEKKRSKDRSP